MSNQSERSTGDCVTPVVVQPGESRAGDLSFFGDRVLVKLLSKDTRGTFAVCEIEVMPQSVSPARTHLYEDQWFYVVAGHFRFDAAGLGSELGPGAAVYVPRRIPFGYTHTGSAAGRLLVVAVPSGLDLLFADIADLGLNSGRLQPDSLDSTLEKHGVVLAGEGPKTHRVPAADFRRAS